MLRIIVLGSAAGGGVPQWNCNCPVCAKSRDGTGIVTSRTQSSLAVSGDGETWCILNCSPDIRQQIIDQPALWPRQGTHRDSPIASVVITNADVDHICGLLTLREKQPFELFATGAVLDVLGENPIFNVLDAEFVSKKQLVAGEECLVGSNLRIEPFLVPGKVALFNEARLLDETGDLHIGEVSEHTIGLRVVSASDDASFFYVPGCAMMTGELAERLRGAALVMFDGTVWEDEEMVAHGLGAKTGRRMGHMSMTGEHGSLAAFASLGVARKVYIHINNSNHVLINGSQEQRQVHAAGWEIAHDGMEIGL